MDPSLQSIVALFPGLVPVLVLASLSFLPKIPAWILSGILWIASLAGSFLLAPGNTPAIQTIWLNSLNFAAVVVFYLIFYEVQSQTLNQRRAQLEKMEKRYQEQEKNKQELKSLLDKSKKDIDKSLLLYGAIKGMGEALSWEEMIPHIDFAVTHCLGVKDYQLYLLDDSTGNHSQTEKTNFQKVLSRGSRLGEAPVSSPASTTQFHQKSTELYLETPIHHGEKTIGILWLRVNRTSPKEREELHANAVDLAEELGLGLQKAQLFSSIEKLSRIDGLTGVFRRQIFNERLNQEFQRAKTFRTSFSVLIGDLDHFKQINDTYGHQAGDEVLRRVGKILKESVYETDLVARYGGEEFVILFPQADPVGVRRKAESLRARIAAESFLFGFNKLTVTMSMGISHSPVHGSDSASLLATADKALYRAKDSGRNRVIDALDQGRSQ